ncbi:MAG: hypothetical protein IJD06_00955 [Clostridia bacterium]|nr:hypothetical protein [Clostridia bacterium]
MANITFDPDNTLAGGLYALTPRESISLGIELCLAVEDAVGRSGCHCGIWPGNISLIDGKLALGLPALNNVGDRSPDALEYIAPEQFWNGENSPAADVYSIGLVLYTALNGGVMPFFAEGSSRGPEERAAALQSRMKGKPIAYPRSACRELGDVVLKAISFNAGDRYPNPGELRQALAQLPESAAIPAVAPVIPLSSQEMQNTRSYKVDKDFEDIEPPRQKKQKKSTVVDEEMDSYEFRHAKPKKNFAVPAVIILVAVIAAALLIFRSCGSDEETDFPISTPPVEQNDVPETEPPAPSEPPVLVPPVTDEPVETPTPETSYQIFVEDVTWEQAKARCEALGGKLATVRSEEELQQIITMAQNAGVRFVWLGAYRAADGTWRYVDGEVMSYAVWDSGEPSAMDADGTREDYLLMWYRPAIGRWTFNDMRNDPISVIPATYGGKTAYVCQFN